jgi:hypothetical protein
MSQYDFGTIVPASKSGSGLATDLNSWRTALHSSHKGAAAPSYKIAGTAWLDDSTTPWAWKMYDGANDIVLGYVDPTNDYFTPGKMFKLGANIASASTVNLATATGDQVTITGTTTITSFGTVPAGQMFKLVFAGALTLTHNATSLILFGANLKTQAGDSIIIVSEGSGNWRLINYTRAEGPGGRIFQASTTWNVSTTGNLAFTGIGFKPRELHFQAVHFGGQAASWGTANRPTGNQFVMYSNNGGTAGAFSMSTAAIGILITTAGNSQTMAMASYDDDGFTISRVNAGAPSASIQFNYTCWE